jgi:hypothetical protein
LDDIVTFLRCLGAVLPQSPELLLADMTDFPQTDGSLEEMLALSPLSPNAAASAPLKRKRVFKFPTTTLRPFGATAVAQDEGDGRKVRFQRRGGALLKLPSTGPQPKPKPSRKEEPKTKAEKIREQKALLAMAAVQARQAQKKLDTQSGEGTGEAQRLASPPAPPPPLEISPVPSPAPSPAPGSGCAPSETVTHLNLSLSSSSSLLSPLPSLLPHSPSPSSLLAGAEEEREASGVYEDDFETESRASSRASSRRCLTPHRLSSPLLPRRPASGPSRPSSGGLAMEKLRSPSRPEGPAPSLRRSFRDSLSSGGGLRES